MTEWRPHKGQQEKFCKNSEFEVLFGGAAGPGKTECLIMLATRHVDKRRYKGLILRRTFPQLQEIIDRCWEYYPMLDGVYRSTEHRWYFPSGATIQLGHMQHEDSKYQYHGQQYHFVGFDELTQFTETQYTFLFSRIRTIDEDIPVRVRATTNPGGIGHLWVKERFIDLATPEKVYTDPETEKRRVFIPALVKDNPTLSLNDPDYVARLEMLPEAEKKRLKYGDWNVFEGQAFADLSERHHQCNSFDIPPEWTKYCVLDWGYAKPFCVHWYAIDYDGVMYLYREWYGNKEGTVDEGVKMRADQVAAGIIERERPGENIKLRYADGSISDPRASFRAKESLGVLIHDDFADAGLFFQKTDRSPGARHHGKIQVHARLKMDEEIDESTGEIVSSTPQFQAFKACEMFWKTMPLMVQDPAKPEDIDTKGPDHAYDAFRYMCLVRPVPPKKVIKMPSGTFRATREKLIKAKKYAQRYGVSLGTAYNKVR